MDIKRGVDSPTRELALFAGAGGGILGGKLLGWQTVCAVEWDAYAAGVLVARQNEGILAPFPIWDDVQTFDGARWRGRVDVVSGGFPCQDISCAGKGAGICGERSGMWAHMARIIGEVRPQYAFIENSPMLTSRGLDRVLADLAAIGFDAEWGTLSSRDVGGCHLRERMWILATDSKGEQGHGGANNSNDGEQRILQPRDGTYSADAANDRGERRQREWQESFRRLTSFPWGEDVRRIEDLRDRPDLPEPLLRGGHDGLAARVDRLRCIGNGQVPRVAAAAFLQLRERIDQSRH